MFDTEPQRAVKEAELRVQEALDEENGGYLSAYIAVTTRAIEARLIATERERVACGSE